jgi:hypothetical protein
MNKWMIVGAMVVGALGLSAALVVGGDRLGARQGADAGSLPDVSVGPPWAVSGQADGSSVVFGPNGLRLSPLKEQSSTLADVLRLWPIEHQVAVVASQAEDGALEAFVDPAQLSFVTGKLVVSLHATPEQLKGLKDRAAKVEFMESTTRRFTLAVGDMADALKAPIRGLSLVPQAQLDAPTVIQRFGPPGLRMTVGTGEAAVEHLLYPDKGIDVALHAKGKDVIQYVSPAQFEDRLLEPLQAARAAQAASAPSAAVASQP